MDNIVSKKTNTRHILCPNCKEQFKWSPDDKSLSRPRVVDPNLSVKEKQKVYLERHYLKKLINSGITVAGGV